MIFMVLKFPYTKQARWEIKTAFDGIFTQ